MNTAYTRTAKTLHWLMAIRLIGLVGLGLYMHELPFSPAKLQRYSWHKWAGVSAFALALGRLAWRVTHCPPALPTGMPPAARLAAHGGHVAAALKHHVVDRDDILARMLPRRFQDALR